MELADQENIMMDEVLGVCLGLEGKHIRVAMNGLGEHDQTNTGHRCRTNRGQRSGYNDHEQLLRSQGYAVILGNKYRGDTLHDSGAVHVYRSTERHTE